MPFIRGRYHINPVMGQALEAAREAEAALAALKARTNQNSGSDSDDGSYGDDATGFRSATDAAATAPVHHIEIEAAELVPNISSRAQRGFVARVHRAPAVPTGASDASSDVSPVGARPFSDGRAVPGADAWRQSSQSSAPAPETHVFADHNDLVDFLRDTLARDANR